MKWWTILLADLFLSLVAGACLWVLAWGDLASSLDFVLSIEPAAILREIVSLRMR
jgi:hypothetical protein